jgi:hypothetical protein
MTDAEHRIHISKSSLGAANGDRYRAFCRCGWVSVPTRAWVDLAEQLGEDLGVDVADLRRTAAVA